MNSMGSVLLVCLCYILLRNISDQCICAPGPKWKDTPCFGVDASTEVDKNWSDWQIDNSLAWLPGYLLRINKLLLYHRALNSLARSTEQNEAKRLDTRSWYQGNNHKLEKPFNQLAGPKQQKSLNEKLSRAKASTWISRGKKGMLESDFSRSTTRSLAENDDLFIEQSPMMSQSPEENSPYPKYLLGQRKIGSEDHFGRGNTATLHVPQRSTAAESQEQHNSTQEQPVFYRSHDLKFPYISTEDRLLKSGLSKFLNSMKRYALQLKSLEPKSKMNRVKLDPLWISRGKRLPESMIHLIENRVHTLPSASSLKQHQSPAGRREIKGFWIQRGK